MYKFTDNNGIQFKVSNVAFIDESETLFKNDTYVKFNV